MGELVDLAAERARRRGVAPPALELGSASPFGQRVRARLEARKRPAWLEEPPADWIPVEEPCSACGQAFEGLELRVGRARFHGRRGRCRAAALALLSELEQALAEEARRSKLWPHDRAVPQMVLALDPRGVPIRDDDDRPVIVPAQAVFPARRLS